MSDNIKVAIKIRPLISREKSEKLREQWEVKQNMIYPIDINGRKNGDSYVFDHIFDSNCSNADIYKTVVHPVVDAAMNGFNGTIFAYGQTSSGKTYTMMGNITEPGIIPIVVQNIFLAIEQAVNRKFLLRVSYMEIYNEKVYDLLDIKNSVVIHENYSGVILNVKEELTDTAEKVYNLMKKGDKARRIGETNMNEKSSRSHAIFRIIIESSDVKDDNGIVNVAHLNLVDLAGSERAALTKATGMRLKEGANINKSLSTLSLVMKQLSESQDFINFRDSKLTRILQSSLGGNALTTIICAVTPASLEETHSTLAFASRAKTVKNKPHLNEVITDEALINRYALEIKKLKKDLEKANDNRNLHLQLNSKLEEKISVLEKCIIYSSQSSGQKKKNTNRRQTWSAPHNSRQLPVIHETDVLKITSCFHNNILDCTDYIDNEVFPQSFFDIENDKSFIPHSERKKRPLYSPSPGDTPAASKQPMEQSIINETQIDSTTSIESKDIVKWLVHETDTPKSVLRDRVSYYRKELASLKDLTDKEKELLCNEHSRITDNLKQELNDLKEELMLEKTLRQQLEKKFEDEKNILQHKLDDYKKKNAELSRVVFQAQKEQNKKNDCEYLVEVYKDKYKKREKELLDLLEESRKNLDTLQNNSSNLNQSISITTDFAISQEMQIELEDYKNQLTLLKQELDISSSAQSVLDLITKVSEKSENIVSNVSDYPEELTDCFTMFKNMLETTSYLLSDDSLINKLEQEKNMYINKITFLQNKENTYDLLVKKQDEEIKHLSENILEYMKQLQSLKAELSTFKNMSKTEKYSQTDVIENNIEESELNSDVLNISNKKSTAESEKTQIKLDNNQTKEYYTKLLLDKDREIEELSDNIMEYLDQLTNLEKELKEAKSNTDHKTAIEDLTQKLRSSEEEYNKIKAENTSLQNQINDLSTKLDTTFNELNQIKLNTSHQTHIEELSRKLIAAEDELNKFKSDISYESQIRDLTQKLSDTEHELNKIKSDTSYETQIEELTHKVNSLKDETHKIKSENILLHSENKELTEKLTITESELSTIKLDNSKESQIEELTQKLKSSQDEVIEIKSENVSLQTQIKELTEKLDITESELSTLKLDNSQESQIEELTQKLKSSQDEVSEIKSENVSLQTQIKELTEKLDIIESELKTIKLDNSKESQIEELTQKLNSSKDEVNQIKSENVSLQTQIKELTEKLDITESELNTIKLDNSKESQIEELTQKLNSSKDEVSEIKSENVSLQTQIKELTEKLDITESELSRIKLDNSQESQIEELIQKLKSSENEVDQIRTENTLLLTQVKELTEKLDVIENELSTIKLDNSQESLTEELLKKLKLSENEVDEIKSENTSLHTQIKDLTEKLNIVETELSTIKLDNSQQTQIEELTIKLNSSVVNEIEQIRSENISLHAQVKELTEKLDTSESELRKIELDISDRTQKISLSDQIRSDKILLQTQIKELAQKLNSSEEEFNQIRSENELSITKLENSYQNQIDNLTQMLNSTEDEVNQIKSDNISLEKEIEVLTKKLYTAEDELNKFKFDVSHETQIEELTQKVKSFEDDINKVKSENISLNSQVKELTEKLDISENELSKIKFNKSQQNQIKNLTLKLNSSVDDINQIKYENELIQTKLDTSYQNQIDNLTQMLSSTEDEINQIKSENISYQTQIEDLIQKLNSSKGEVCQIKSENILLNSQVKELTEKLSENELSKIELNKSQQNQIKNLTLKLNSSVDDMNNQIKYENELIQTKLDTSYQNQIDNLTQILSSTEDEINQIKTENISYQTQIEDLIQKLNSSKDEVCQIKSENVSLQSQIEDLTETLKSSENEVNKLTEQLKESESKFELQDEVIAKYELNTSIQKEEIEQKSKEIEHLAKRLSICDDTLLSPSHKSRLNKTKPVVITTTLEFNQNCMSLSQEEYNNLTEKLAQLEHRLSQKERKARKYKNELHDKKNLITQLTQEVKLLNEKISSYEDHFGAYAFQLEDIMSGNKESKKQMITEINTLQQMITTYQDLLDRYDPKDKEQITLLVEKNFETLCKNHSKLINFEKNLTEVINKLKADNDLILIKKLKLAEYENIIRRYESDMFNMQYELDRYKYIDANMDINSFLEKLKLNEEKIDKYQSQVEELRKLVNTFIKPNEIQAFESKNDNEITKNYQKNIENCVELTFNDKLSYMEDNLENYSSYINHFMETIKSYKLQEKNLENKQLNIQALNTSNKTTYLLELKSQFQKYASELSDLLKAVHFCVNKVDKCDVLDTEFESNKNLIIEKNNIISDLNVKLINLQAEHEKLKESFNSVKEEFSCYYNATNTFKTEETEFLVLNLLNDKDNEILSLKSKIYKTECRIQQIEAYINKLTEKLNDGDFEQIKIEQEQQELSEKEIIISNLKKVLSEHSVKVEQCNNELKNLKEKLHTCIKELEAIKLKNEFNKATGFLNDDTIVFLTEEVSQHEDILEKYEIDTSVLTDTIIFCSSLLQKLKDYETSNQNLLDNKEHLERLEIESKEYKSVLESNQTLIVEKEILTHKIHDYEEKLKIYEVKFEAIKSLESELSLNIEAISEKDCEINHLKNDIANKMQQIEDYTIEINDINIRNSKNVADFESQLVIKDNMLKEKDSILKQKEEEISKISLQIQNLTEQITSVQNELNSKDNLVVKLTHQINSLNTDISDKIQQIENYETKLNDNSIKLSENETILKQKQDEIKTLSFNAKDMSNQLNQLQRELNIKDNELLSLKSDLTLNRNVLVEKDIEINKLKKDIATKIEQIENYKMELNDNAKYSIDLTDSKNLLAAKDTELNEIETLLNQKVEEIKNLNLNFQETVNELMQLKKEYNFKDNQLKSLEAQIILNKNILSEKDEEINDMRKDISNKTQEIENYKIELNDNRNLKNQLSEKEVKLSDLETVLKKKEDEIKNLHLNMQDLSTQLKCIESDLKSNSNLLEEKNNEISNNLLQIENYKKALDDYKNQFKSKDTMMQNIEAILKQKDDEIKTISCHNEDLINKLSKTLNEITEKDNLLKEKESYFDNRSFENDQIRKNFELQIHNLNNNIAKLKSEIQELETSNKEYTLSVESLQNQVSSLQEQIQQKDDICKEQKCFLNNLQAEKIKHQDTEIKLKSLQKTLIEKNNEIAQTLKDFTHLKSEQSKYLETDLKLRQITETLKEKNSIIEKLERDIKNINIENESKLISYAESLTDKNNIIQKLKTDLEKFQYEWNHNESKIKSITELLHEKNNDILQLTRQKEKLLNNFSSQEDNSKLKKENEELKKNIVKVRQKASTQIANFQKILNSLNSENEQLKLEINSSKAVIQDLQNKLTNSDKNNTVTTLLSKVKNLELENKNYLQTANYLQEETTKKTAELREYKKKIQYLKLENSDILNCVSGLKEKLRKAEEQLKTANSNIELLQMEKDNYNENAKVLEESLEDVKYELYELKSKERDKILKVKRQSLHDSSRILTEIENPGNEQQEKNYNKSIAGNNCNNDACKKLISCKEQELKELNDKFINVENEFKNLRKKYEMVKNLCTLRKKNVQELQLQIKALNNK